MPGELRHSEVILGRVQEYLRALEGSSDLRINAISAERLLGWKWVARFGTTLYWLVPGYIPLSQRGTGSIGIVGPFEVATRPEKFDQYMVAFSLPRPSQNAADDYLILRAVCEQWRDADDYHDLEGRWGLFWNGLAEILRSRDPYYRDTVNANYLDYMAEYRPGDYARAALFALGEKV